MSVGRNESVNEWENQFLSDTTASTLFYVLVLVNQLDAAEHTGREGGKQGETVQRKQSWGGGRAGF